MSWIAQAQRRILLVATAGLLALPAAASAAPPPVGGLTQLSGPLGCFTTAASGSCQLATGIADAESVVVSPDGRYVYLGSFSTFTGPRREASLLAFSRDPATGELTQLPGTTGCYTADGSSSAGPSTCTKVEGLGAGDGRDFVITSDGKWAYLVRSALPAAVVIFKRDPATGALTQLPGAAGCLTVDGVSNGVANACGPSPALGATYQPIVSPDGRSVYIASQGGQSLTIFNVESAPACRPTTTSTAYQSPATVSLSCSDPDGDPVTPTILTAPGHGTLGATANGTVTYTPATGYSGPDSFTFDATDGTNTGAPATATIAVGAPTVPPVAQGAAQSTPRPPAAHITKVGQSHRRWRESRHGGTTFSFTLNRGARVTFAFTQKNRRRILGRLTVVAHRGPNKLGFNGRLGAVTLKPGTYTVTIRIGASAPTRLTFTIVR
jgi:hypothetical protein